MGDSLGPRRRAATGGDLPGRGEEAPTGDDKHSADITSLLADIGRCVRFHQHRRLE